MREPKLIANNVIIEVTRKCNLCCPHCLRGEAQRKNIKSEYITAFLKQFKQISSLTFTGGEPFLNIEAMEYTLKELKRLKIDVNLFYIVTNGTKPSITDRALRLMFELWLYQSEKDTENFSMVQLSNDQWHNVDEIERQQVIDTLSAFSFFSLRHELKYESIISEGRAESWCGRELIKTKAFEYFEYCFDGDIENLNEDIYLNANGYILNNCDLSYESQNKYKICKADELTAFAKVFADRNV